MHAHDEHDFWCLEVLFVSHSVLFLFDIRISSVEVFHDTTCLLDRCFAALDVAVAGLVKMEEAFLR